jgi:periplasmic protein TonB
MLMAAVFLRPLRAAALAAVLAATVTTAWAQFSMVPVPMQVPAATSGAETPVDYKRDAAKHLYASFPMRIYRGKLPPLLYGVAIVDVVVDAEGKVLEAQLRRPPAAPEVGPWVLSMIRRAPPFPLPAKLGEKVTFSEIWLVDKGGNFQLDTLTEGQR